MNFQPEHQENLFQWKQGGGTHIFIRENLLVLPWSCMLQGEHQHILMNHRQVVFDFIILEVVMKLEMSALLWKILQELVCFWIMD